MGCQWLAYAALDTDSMVLNAKNERLNKKTA